MELNKEWKDLVEEDLDSILPDKETKSIILWKYQFSDHYRFERTVRIYLEAMGYTNIMFYSIDYDSFGPLVRGMEAIDPRGQKRLFSYG